MGPQFYRARVLVESSRAPAACALLISEPPRQQPHRSAGRLLGGSSTQHQKNSKSQNDIRDPGSLPGDGWAVPFSAASDPPVSGERFSVRHRHHTAGPESAPRWS